MANTREIQSRMKSIEDTMKITNAMYMISSTKLRRAKKELEDTEPYFFTLQGMLARIIRHLPEVPMVPGQMHRRIGKRHFSSSRQIKVWQVRTITTY